MFLPASTVNRLIPEAGATVRFNVLLLLNTFFQQLLSPVEGGVEWEVDIVLDQVGVGAVPHAWNLRVEMSLQRCPEGSSIQIIETLVITRGWCV